MSGRIEKKEDAFSEKDFGKDGIIKYIDQHAGIFTELSDRIWENPELSLKEFNAVNMYVEMLREGGFSVEEGLGGIPTAFSASFGKGRPVIGILGEFDALSGLSQERALAEKRPVTPGGPGHGCGHNLLGAGALCAAFSLKAWLEESGTPGTVVFFGCPGEEGGASKAFLAREGKWRSLDAALTWHPADVNEVRSGTNNSSIQVVYRFHGLSSHAASDPENGRSALDAAELMNTGVQYLREHMGADCRVHYAFLDAGGVSPNVVQADAAVLYMVRANKVRDSLKLLGRVDKIAEGAALMTETTLSRQFIDGTAEMVPNFELEALLYRNFLYAGVPEYTASELALAEGIKKSCPLDEAPGIAPKYDGEAREEVMRQSCRGTKPLNDFLVPLCHSTAFHPGSSDVGDVSWQTPTAWLDVCAFVSGAPGHSWQNVSCAGSSIGHKALLCAGKVLACAAAELFCCPDILERARKEFDRRTADGYVCPIEEGAVPTAI